MSTDYKWDIQERAEEIAWNDHDCSFYELTEAQQEAVYKQATEGWTDSLASRADYLNDIAKEN